MKVYEKRDPEEIIGNKIHEPNVFEFQKEYAKKETDIVDIAEKGLDKLEAPNTVSPDELEKFIKSRQK